MAINVAEGRSKVKDVSVTLQLRRVQSNPPVYQCDLQSAHTVHNLAE